LWREKRGTSLWKTHAHEIAESIRDFLARILQPGAYPSVPDRLLALADEMIEY
jgi:hypothetical protein